MIKIIKSTLPTLLFVLGAWTTEAVDDATAFFKISKITFYNTPPRKGVAPYEVKNKDTPKEKRIFLPFVGASVKTAEKTATLNLVAKAYFYDENKKLLATVNEPCPITREDGALAGMPVFALKGKDMQLCFPLPKEVAKSRDWQVVIVFGDKNSVTAKVYPDRNLPVKYFSFPELELVGQNKFLKREKAVDPLIEHVIKTNVPEQPQITLFLRRPVGVKDFSEAKGVLAVCLLAGCVADVKRRLQQADAKDELDEVFRFAETHKLAILCWGSRSLWNPSTNWDDLKRQDEAQMDHVFDKVARAWTIGVNQLSNKYGIPRKNFLLWGFSGSAQYSMRLALRQPEYFLAVRVHIPSSFDRPTPEANKILWCLSTGEEEVGYDRSLRFLAACQKIGYPIIYKAVPGLGHANHPLTEKFGLVFLEYALSLQEERDNLDATLTKLKNDGRSRKTYQPWPESFKTPEFFGDVFRQQVDSPEQATKQPAVLIPLPTKNLADAWAGK